MNKNDKRALENINKDYNKRMDNGYYRHYLMDAHGHKGYNNLGRVLLMLPKEVKEYVESKILIISNKPNYTFSLIPFQDREHIIVLSVDASTHIIAHEISHCWLKHTGKDRGGIFAGSYELYLQGEKETTDLAKQWLKDMKKIWNT